MGALCSVTPVTTIANDIYIQQVGDTLDLDIVQDGQDNSIGTSPGMGNQDIYLDCPYQVMFQYCYLDHLVRCPSLVYHPLVECRCR